MNLTDIPNITAELVTSLEENGIGSVKQLRAADDATLLKLMPGRTLKRIRLALEKVVDDTPFAKFEWPASPNGKMLIWRDEPHDQWARFVAGFYITNDTDEIAILRHRASTKGDIFEVQMDVDTPSHAQAQMAMPQAGDVDMSALSDKYLKGE